MIENNKICTRDIYLAAIYISLGVLYSHADKRDVRHQEFIFNGDVAITEKIRADYINGVLMVNAVKFKEAIQRMKSEIHSY